METYIKYNFNYSHKYCLTCKLTHKVCINCTDSINSLSNTIIFQCCNYCHYIPADIKIKRELAWHNMNSRYFFGKHIRYPSWQSEVIKTLFMIVLRFDNPEEPLYLPIELWITILKHLKVRDIGREIDNHSCNRNHSQTLTWCKKCRRWHKYEEGNILTIMENYKDNLELMKQLLYLIFFTSRINPFMNVNAYSNAKIKKYFSNNYYVRSIGLFINYKRHLMKTIKYETI
jgi:hypothetical protein